MDFWCVVGRAGRDEKFLDQVRSRLIAEQTKDIEELEALWDYLDRQGHRFSRTDVIDANRCLVALVGVTGIGGPSLSTEHPFRVLQSALSEVNFEREGLAILGLCCLDGTYFGECLVAVKTVEALQRFLSSRPRFALSEQEAAGVVGFLRRTEVREAIGKLNNSWSIGTARDGKHLGTRSLRHGGAFLGRTVFGPRSHPYGAKHRGAASVPESRREENGKGPARNSLLPREPNQLDPTWGGEGQAGR